MKSSDLKVCAEFIKRAYSAAPFNEKWEKNNASKYILCKFKYCDKSSYVLEENRKILGFILVSLGYWANGPQAIIEEIVIDPDYHHKGLGSLLMKYVDDKFKKMKIKSVLLWTNQDSLAYKFHQKHGFSLSTDLILMDKDV